MVYLPASKLKEGMVLAQSIPSINIAIPFATVGFRLDQRSIRKIQDLGIQGAYIEIEQAEGIVPHDFVEPELKGQLIQSIKKVFEHSTKQTSFCSSRQEYQEISSAAETVVMNVLNSDKILFQMIDVRDYDNYTYSHSLYVGMLSVLVGRYLGYSQAELHKLALCGLLHDVGKTEIPINIINKPGRLTTEEMEIVRRHPVLSAKKLSTNELIPLSVMRGVRCHHERFDGSGYPDGLTGVEIPLYGRILAIADVYDALNSTRPYRMAWSPKKIFDYLTAYSDIYFDPELLTAFLHCMAAYPVGMLVHLSDGSTAVVKDNTPGYALRPVVRIISPGDKKGMEIDLAKERLNLTIVDEE